MRCRELNQDFHTDSRLPWHQAEKPDLVFMDITMPNMNGMESLKEILAMDKKAQVVMISAAGQQKKIIEALKIGAERFITKPFEKEEVLSCMEAVMKSN